MNSGRKRYLIWNLRDALEILNGQKEFQGEVWWTTDFHKVLSFHQKEKAIYFSTGYSWYILPLVKAIRKEKKGHPTTPHDLDEKYSYDSSNVNCISNKCRECSPTKILSGWDEASSSESNTEGSSSIDEKSDEVTHTQWTREDRKMKKIIKSVTKETFYRQWEETVVGGWWL